MNKKGKPYDEQQMDEHITTALHRHSDYMSQHKEEIWERIEQELQLKQGSSENTARNSDAVETVLQRRGERKMKHSKKRKGNKVMWIAGLVAAASVVGIMVTSNTGQALVNQIKQYFEPEKKVVEEYEGMPEEKDIVLQDTQSGYVIYIDEERYKLVAEEGQDVIVTKEPLDERYPEVSMTIKQIKGVTPEAAIAEQQQLLASSFAEVDAPVQVTEPIEATLISAKDGQNWDSPVSKVYVFSNGYGGSFVITEKYFLEASEGHGARFYHMLEQFTLVDPKQ